MGLKTLFVEDEDVDEAVIAAAAEATAAGIIFVFAFSASFASAALFAVKLAISCVHPEPTSAVDPSRSPYKSIEYFTFSLDEFVTVLYGAYQICK
jgi:hypothetical protein